MSLMLKWVLFYRLYSPPLFILSRRGKGVKPTPFPPINNELCPFPSLVYVASPGYIVIIAIAQAVS